MTVSKETIEKAKRLVSLKDEAEKIEAELRVELGPYFDGCFIEGFFVADEPEGSHQQDGEYCNQYTGYTEDTGDGTYYYPSENPKEYLAVMYSF